MEFPISSRSNADYLGNEGPASPGSAVPEQCDFYLTVEQGDFYLTEEQQLVQEDAGIFLHLPGVTNGRQWEK